MSVAVITFLRGRLDAIATGNTASNTGFYCTNRGTTIAVSAVAVIAELSSERFQCAITAETLETVFCRFALIAARTRNTQALIFITHGVRRCSAACIGIADIATGTIHRNTRSITAHHVRRSSTSKCLITEIQPFASNRLTCASLTSEMHVIDNGTSHRRNR